MKSQTKVLIFLASAILFGYAYSFDMPQALQKPLREEPFNYTNLEFNLLYFFTFLPVALFQIPIGMLIDKYPLKRSLFFFVFLSFVSTVFIGLAFELMIPGYKWVVNITRATFGVCGQALFTVQAILLTYFAKEDYEISIGICLCLPFVFDALNSIITTFVYDQTGNMALPWYIGASICLISIIVALIINKKYLKQIQQIQITQATLNKQLITSQSTVQVYSVQKQGYQQSYQQSYKQGSKQGCNQSSKQGGKQNQQFNCKSIAKLNSQFWVVCGAVFFYQAALGPYFDNLNDMIVKRFNIQYTDAGKMLLIPEALLVFFGYGLSKLCTYNPKWRRKILLGVAIIYFILISLVYLLPNTRQPTFIYYLVICLFLLVMSMMFACEYCALIGSTSYFVHKSELGTAYGVATTALGLCQCVGPLVNSAILDQYQLLEDSYVQLSLFGAGLAIFPIIFAIWMYRKEFQILDYNLKDDFTQKQLN